MVASVQCIAKGSYKLLVWILVLLSSLNASASTFDDENLALLDVVFDRQIIGDGIDAYIDGDLLFMPLIDLVDLLELNIVVDEAGANGVVLQSQGQFLLSYNQAEGWSVTEGGEVILVDDALIKRYEGFIYIDRQLANQWFGTKFELDFNDSYLNLTVTKTLPFQKRLLRQSRKIAAQGDYGEPEQPALKLPYAWAEIPSVDARVNYLSRRHDKDQSEDFSNVFYAMRTYGDLLGMSAQTFWTGRRDEGVKGASISFDRYDSSRSMGGFLGLSQLSFGDLSHPTLPLAPGSYGRGVILGNDIVSGDSSRNVRDIEGDFYPGWEVELYLNKTIIGYQTIGEDGHYRFEDVILFQGKNEFVLKFYGPSGQVEEKKEYINVGANSDSSNNFYYTLSVSQPDRKLYEIGDDAEKAEAADDVYQATLTTRYTLGNVLSFQAGAQETNGAKTQQSNTISTNTEDGVPEDDSIRKQYYSLEMQANLDAHTFSLTAAKQNDREVSYLYRLGGNLGGMAYRLDYSDYGEFQDPEADSAIKNFYGLSLSQRFKRGSAILRMNRSENEARYLDEYRFNVSGSLYRFNLSNGLIYESTVYDEAIIDKNSGEVIEDVETLSGAFIVSTSLSSFIARLTTSYDVIPDNQLSKLNLSTSYRLYPKANVNFDFSHSLITDSNQYRLGLNWQLSHFQITPSVIYHDDGQWQGQVQLSTSLGKRTGRLGSYYDLASDPSMSKGAVRARLFEDQNFDGEYQLGEPLLSGGEIKAVQARRRGRSNKAGVAWLDSMQPWSPTDIVVDSNTLDAGAMALTREPFSLASRPGKVVELDLPFTRVGDFDGVVYEIIDSIHTPIRGVSVILINDAKEQVSRQVTDTDGYFDFSKLLPGNYTLEVEGAELLSVLPEMITILPSGNYVSGVEVMVKRVFKSELDEELLLLDEKSKDEKTEDESTFAKPPLGSLAPPAFGNPAPVPEVVTVIDEPVLSDNVLIAEPEVAVEASPAMPDSMVKPKAPFSDAPAIVNVHKATSAWSLQAGSFSSRIIADNFANKLQSAGYASKITPVTVKQRDFYRVYAVGFDDRASALNKKAIFDAKFGVKSLVVKL